jgi:hypothetical protein
MDWLSCQWLFQYNISHVAHHRSMSLVANVGTYKYWCEKGVCHQCLAVGVTVPHVTDKKWFPKAPQILILYQTHSNGTANQKLLLSFLTLKCKGGLLEAPVPVSLPYTPSQLLYTSETLPYTSLHQCKGGLRVRPAFTNNSTYNRNWY